MAQETAGTIGIPVIQNEVIPALENYARRQERAAALEAAQNRRLLELQYKKAQELEKLSVPDMPAPKEGYFQGYRSQKRQDLVSGLTADVASRKYSQGDINTKANIGIGILGDIDAKNKFRSDMLNTEAENLRKIGVTGATPGMIQTYVDAGLSGKDPDAFFESPHTQNFTQFVLGDYKNISPAVIGDNTLKGKKPNKIRIESGDTTEDFEYYDVFDVGTVKDPATGSDIVAAKTVNIPKAEAYVEADPQRKILKDSWVASRAKILEADPTYYGLPQDEKEAKAKEKATQEFYDDAFKQFMVQKYGRSKDEPRMARSRSGSNSYSKFTVGLDDLRLASNETVPVYGLAAPSGTALDVDIPQNTTYINTETNLPEVLSDSGAKLKSPSIGYAARKKGTSTYIDPKDFGSTNIDDVEFVPGVYGIKSTLQSKGGGGFINIGGSSGQTGPYVTGEQIFIQEGLPKWKTLASEILKKKGKSYDKAKSEALSELKKKFIQSSSASAPAASSGRFKTKKKK